MEDLITTIFQIWENISENEIRNLIDSMSERLQAVVNNNGMHSGY